MRQEVERGLRGANYARTWTHARGKTGGEGSEAEKGESAGWQESAACHHPPTERESKRHRDSEATPSSCQLCWPLASHRHTVG